MFDEQYNSYIGVDETGVGDYFSPVISVACYIPFKNIDRLIALGVADSKTLSASFIRKNANEIKSLVIWRKNVLSQTGYNNLINAGINNNEIKTLIHTNSINHLKKYLGDANQFPVLIDQYVANENIFQNHYKKLKSISWINIEKPKNLIVLKTKAEQISLSVATASIISRSLLLDYMDEQTKKYNFEFRLGASNLVIEQGISFVKKYGFEELKKVAKISFKTTQKILESIESSKEN